MNAQPKAQPINTHQPVRIGKPYGRFDQIQVDSIAKLGSWNDITKVVSSRYVPYWTDPGYQEDMDMEFDGQFFKFRHMSDKSRKLRPAIKPTDLAKNPTEYALMHGIDNTDTRNDGFGHSGLTPIRPEFQKSAISAEDEAYYKSLQRYVFASYDTSELVDQGAMNPRHQVAWPPALDEELHPFLSRDRWSQLPENDWPGLWDIKYGADLNGVPGEYNVQTNDTVWQALQPALKLTSRIMKMGHPYWRAMMNVHSLRPVDAFRDGRTDQQRQDEGGRPYVSVWADTDPTRNPTCPAPYPALQDLQNMDFTAESSQQLVMELLNKDLVLGISTLHQAYGRHWSRQHMDGWYSRIAISPDMIWPLLAIRVPNSVKAMCSFTIAATLLHEFAHAAAAAMKTMMTRDMIVRDVPFGAALSNDVVETLLVLGDQVIGPRWWHSDQEVLWRPGAHLQWFAGNSVQGEDGRHLDVALWGGALHPWPSVAHGYFTLTTLMFMVQWPDAAAEPVYQGTWDQNQTGGAYDRFLMAPAVPSWTDGIAIPIEWYTRYFDPTWWESSGRKYGDQAFKLSAQDAPSKTLKRSRADGATSDNLLAVSAVFGQDLSIWLYDTLITQLKQQGYYLTSLYFERLIRQAADRQVLSSKLKNEERAWGFKLRTITLVADEVIRRYQAMAAAILAMRFITAGPIFYEDLLPTVCKVNNLTLRTLERMAQLNILVEQEVAYQQAMLNEYAMQEPEVREILYERLAAQRERINGFGNLITGRTTALVLAEVDPQTVGGGWETIMRETAQSSVSMEAGPLPESISAQMNGFLRLIEAVRLSHTRFHSSRELLEANMQLVLSFRPDGEQAVLPQRTQKLAQITLPSGQIMGNVKSIKRAALKEMRTMKLGPVRTMLLTGLDILDDTHGDWLDYTRERNALGEQSLQQRRKRLRREGFAILANENQARADRSFARSQNVPNVEADISDGDLARRIYALARGDAEDLGYLQQVWSMAEIQTWFAENRLEPVDESF